MVQKMMDSMIVWMVLMKETAPKLEWKCAAALHAVDHLFLPSLHLTTKVDNQQVVVIQQQPQYVPVVQQVVQQPVIRQQVVQPVPQPVAQPRPTAQTTTTDWARKAKNLEMARNWEEAAKAYEKADCIRRLENPSRKSGAKPAYGSNWPGWEHRAK